MQINAISSYDKGFTGSRERIDEAIVQDDKLVREYAYLKAMDKVKDKKHKKITNALWYSIPIAAGLSTAVLTKGKVSLFGKEIGGFASKLATSIAGALPWAVTLGVADAVVGGNNLALKKSENVREAERKHPILTVLGILAAGTAALFLVPKAASKLLNKIGPKTYEKLGKLTEKAAEKLNVIKTPKFIQKPLSKLSEKMPSVIKNGTLFGISILPETLLLTTFFHTINHNIDRKREFNKNYTAMKETQLNLAKARVNELKLENDFLKQTPENEEDIAIINDNLKDMPEEVIEKIDANKQNNNIATETEKEIIDAQEIENKQDLNEEEEIA